MNSLLPNMRLLCLPSESLGQDWYEKEQELDQTLEGRGMDLAEESVYLLFSDTPTDILDGGGQCLVARSVIGPKIQVETPFHLIDWVAAPVWRERIQGETWMDLLGQAEDVRLKAEKGPRPLAKSFTLCVRRHLKTGLILETDVLFNE